MYFWENLGHGMLDMPKPQSASQPTHSFTDSNVSIGDMGGDGLADLIVNAPPVSGFYESKPDGNWKSFKRFETFPSFDLNDPNIRLVDLTGDGLSDVLVTADNYFIWYQCLGEAGYAELKRIPRTHDLEQFPDVYFADPSGRVRLADMTGDGLTDIVLMHDGRIDYWPNLGRGKFGSRITMKGTPRIGFGYDPKRLFLADIDGSGCADLVYVEPHQVRYWFNQSGNGFNDPRVKTDQPEHTWKSDQVIRGTPNINDLTAIQFIDFYGTGTTTLLWSYDAGQYAGIVITSYWISVVVLSSVCWLQWITTWALPPVFSMHPPLSFIWQTRPVASRGIPACRFRFRY
ncbi:MAG: VCBS repeat-containing protein [Thiolinea sp.]